MQYDFLRNANVEILVKEDKDKHPVATAIIGDKYTHTFDSHSRISKQLDIMSPADLAGRLTGGDFFFVNDSLHDFRDGQYAGFVHTDESIENINDLLGITENTKHSVRVHENVTSRDFILGRQWSNHGIEIPEFKDGGAFKSELHFGWSPFIKTINSAFMLYRLVCTNGMRGMRNFMNTKIPLVNRWEEHLEIANRQIQNKLSAVVERRFAAMPYERASVAELDLLHNHIKIRREAKVSNVTPQNITRLINLERIVSPRAHLSDVYKDAVFNDKSIAAQQPSHLTTFDTYNIITELRSHTNPVDKSSTRALDLMANDMVFSRKRPTTLATSNEPKLCAFSDPDAAFFGEMN